MVKKLLFGTTNPRKFQDIAGIAETLPLDLLAPWDLDLQLHVDESGNHPEENACIKALAYANAAGMPTLALDSGLFIDGLDDARQPGVHVRRVGGRALSDEEMVTHYANVVRELGGHAKGRWVTALAVFAMKGGVRSICVEHATQFTAVPSAQRNPGNPLNSLQIDVQTGTYYAEQNTKLQPQPRVKERFAARVEAFLASELQRL